MLVREARMEADLVPSPEAHERLELNNSPEYKLLCQQIKKTRRKKLNPLDTAGLNLSMLLSVQNVHFSQILFLPRSEGSSIAPGERAELFSRLAAADIQARLLSFPAGRYQSWRLESP